MYVSCEEEEVRKLGVKLGGGGGGGGGRGVTVVACVGGRTDGGEVREGGSGFRLGYVKWWCI
jgi:hypothetical protein